LRGRDGEGGSTGSDRRSELVLIAYRQIATLGFEGLRVRDVAAQAGINNATLHHHFPTKEALIQAVVEHLLKEFQIGHAPRRARREPSPIEELRYEFEDTRYRLRDAPETYVVLMELYVRSLRNRAIARVLEMLERQWRSHLLGILERGVRTGAFRCDLVLADAATMIMVQLKGLCFHVALGKPSRSQVDRLISQLAAETERRLIG
jgi:TetR/AcrR family transcriptional repressor of nem operon